MNIFSFINPPRSNFDTYPFLPTLQSSKPMSSSRKKFHLKRHPVVVDIGCSCKSLKISSFFSSLSKQRKPNKFHSNFSPSTNLTTTTSNTTSTSFSPFQSPKQSMTQMKKKKKKKKKKGGVEESVAIEKESYDPFFDFRDSMLQMIVEKEIYNWDDLRELLHLSLSLNSPSHHQLILQAFAEICNGVVM